MNIIRKIAAWFGDLFRTVLAKDRAERKPRKAVPPVHFSGILSVKKPPENNEVAAGMLYCVVAARKTKWAMFKCPCGCGSVITLSLQPVHNPHWRLGKEDSGRATLHPSVWRDKGCLSHFWVKDGRVYWCANTGAHPDTRNIL